ncbi:hypothetical protein [Aeoliella mucimassa]|nr:hypothetical protein [Aeoliella mucimassa]
MNAWPSIAATNLGRQLGRLFRMGPRISVLTVPTRPGWFIALATTPITAFLYFNKIVPRTPLVLFGAQNPWCRRYRLTNKQVIIEHPFDALSTKRADQATFAKIGLTEFDTAELEEQSGYEWYRASDIVFRREGKEVLRLPAVPHAEAFRQTCLKARQAVIGVAEANKPAAAAS